MYFYGLLRTDKSIEAEEHNKKLLGETTLGIKVTDKSLTDCCGLGNLDPQHGTDIQPDSSAIRVSLTSFLPPEGATLVTIRPDADVFGAMAVFTLRAESRSYLIRRGLIEVIHSIDNLGLARAKKENPKVTEYELEVRTIQQIVLNNGKKWPFVGDQVWALSRMLDGSMSRDEMNDI